MNKHFYVYIMTNRSGTLYIGMTNNIKRRLYEHRHKLNKGFTEKYNIDRLLYLEVFATAEDAIAREKQLKRWGRRKKISLIHTQNPTLRDLSEDWE